MSRRRLIGLLSAATVSLVGAPSAVHAATSTADAATAPFVSRMSARYQPYTDRSGTLWGPRSASLGTLHLSATLRGKRVAGTEEDDLYAVNAFGVTGYRLAVPRVATYRVRLLMVEDFHSSAGKRVFDVSAEGSKVVRDVDIVATAGKATAHDVTFPVYVADGHLDLAFTKKLDMPTISAIEVVEQRLGEGEEVRPRLTFASRMTARSTPVTDSQGQVWRRMGPGFGTTRRAQQLVGKDVRGTEDDELYQVSGFGGRGMLVPVPAAADYRVRLLMAEGYWSKPGQRVFDVLAEGRQVAAGVDIAGVVGKGAAHEISFPVRVEDGMLMLQFVARADNPMVAAIEVTSTDPAAKKALPNPALVPLPSTSVYRQDITGAPTATDSATLTTRLRADIDSGLGHNAAVNAYAYNASFHRVDASTPRVTVKFDDCQRKGYVPNHLFDQEKYFVDVPVPVDARSATGTDAQMSIYDPAADKIWEFWQMKRTSDGGWSACWGGRIDRLSTSTGVFPPPFGVTASGLLMAGGVIGVEEAARGQIDHALYLTVKEASRLISYPANRTDGNGTDADLLTEGQRLRLDPSLDVSSLGLTPLGEAIARAAQKYGFIVSDRAGSVGLATESGRAKQARTGLNPWDVLLGGQSYAAMTRFPWDRVEALPIDHGKPADPAPASPGS